MLLNMANVIFQRSWVNMCVTIMKPNEVYTAAQEALNRNNVKEYRLLLELYKKMLVS